MIVIGRSRAQSTTPSALDLRANFTSLFTPSSPTEASGTLNSISLALLSEEKVLSNYCPLKLTFYHTSYLVSLKLLFKNLLTFVIYSINPFLLVMAISTGY